MDGLDALLNKPATWDRRGLGLRLDSPEALAIIGVDDASEAAMMHVVAGRLDAVEFRR